MKANELSYLKTRLKTRAGEDIRLQAALNAAFDALKRDRKRHQRRGPLPEELTDDEIVSRTLVSCCANPSLVAELALPQAALGAHAYHSAMDSLERKWARQKHTADGKALWRRINNIQAERKAVVDSRLGNKFERPSSEEIVSEKDAWLPQSPVADSRV